MATIRLVPSTYYLSNSSYLSVSSASNMYTNTDSTTYATVTNSRSSTSSYYIYIRGFNFDDVPSGAIINSFTIKLKARESGVSTSSSYKPHLANGTSTINGSCNAITTSAATNTFTGVSADWDTITGYGNNFGIRINCRRASKNTTSYMYIYGAEILVDYTLPVYYDINIQNNTSAMVTVSDDHLLEGSDAHIYTNTISGISITDNGTDITNQFVYETPTASYDLETQGSYGFALNSNNYYQSQNKGVDKSCAVCRITFDLPVAADITFTYINYAEQSYDFSVFGNVDVALSTNYYPAGSSGATISETSYKRACNTSSYNSSSAQTLTYSNVSAGEHFIDVKYSKDDASADNNDTLQFKVAVTLNSTPEPVYIYTISNINADHTIIVQNSGSGPKIYIKQNGSWVQCSKVYKKINGSWVEQIDLSNVFSTSANYVKIN